MKLKLLALTAALSLCFSTQINAQTKAQEKDPIFKEKDLVVTVGYGFPDWNRFLMRRWYGSYNYNNYSRSVSGFGPFLLKADYGVVKFDWGHTLGIGGVLGFSGTTIKQEWRNTTWYDGNGNLYQGTVTNRDKYTNIIIGVRGTYHIYVADKLDCYGALSIGYSIGTYKHTTSHPSYTGYYNYSRNSYFFHSLAVGARYYFSENFGVYGEAGWDVVAPLQVGIALKL